MSALSALFSLSDASTWWLLAGAAAVLELVTGTLYLLMLVPGLAAAALAATCGLGQSAQFVVAAMVCAAALFGCRQWRRRGRPEPTAQANVNVNLDIGEILHVEQWNADGTASVHYRGAHWTAIHRVGVIPSPGAHRVAELVGTRLLVDKI